MDAVRWAVTAAALFGFYLLFAGTVSAAEAGFGTGIAVTAAVYVLVLHHATNRRLKLHAPWLRLAWGALSSLARDSAVVGRHLLAVVLGGTGDGAVTNDRFDPGGFTPPASARRALVTLAASIAPNGYVLWLDDRPPRALVTHHLVPGAVQAPDDRKWPI